MHRTIAGCGGGVLCQDFPAVRLITLNNPKSLNALDFRMVRDLHRIYLTEPAPDASLHVIKGAGTKAFCAGGDVIGVTTNRPPGCARHFFYWQYQIDYRVHHLPAGQVCLWNGYVLGGGVGLSMGSRYRVATESACYALPEAAIGMIPDVGASWFLPRLPVPGLGLYMGLTGYRVRGADLVHVGLATHYVPSDHLPYLEEELCSLRRAHDAEMVLDTYASPRDKLPPCTLTASLPFLAEHFALTEAQTVPAILKACAAHAKEVPLAKAAASVLLTYSPTALAVALEVLRRGSRLNSLREAFQMEYCAAQHVVAQHEFREGVRALLIDKDKKPRWSPATYDGVTKEVIEAYFKPTTPDQLVWDPVKPVPS